MNPLWTQGISTGADLASGSPNVWTWNEESTNNSSSNFEPVNNLNSNPGAGTGFLAYVYEDNDPQTAGIQGGFPKTISSNSTASGQFSPTVNSNGDSFTLIGNPFFRSIDFDDLSKNDLSSVVYVWNPATSEWDTWDSMNSTGDLSDGLIAPLQGFFVKTISTPSSPSLTIDETDMAEQANFRGKAADDTKPMALRLELTNNENDISNSTWLSFSTSGSTNNKVIGDALKLESLNQNYIQLSTTKAEDNSLLDINHLPSKLKSKVEIPVKVNSTMSGSYTISVTDINLPQGISMNFNNNVRNSTIPVDQGFETTLTIEANQDAQKKPAAEALIKSSAKLKQTSKSTSYSITIKPKTATSTEAENDFPKTVELQQNYPNPFNPTTNIRFDLPKEQELDLEVYDLMGRRVAQLLSDEKFSAGSHSVTFTASGLSSGVYIYQLQTNNGKTFTKKLTLIK